MSDGAVLAREQAMKMGKEDVKDRILGFYRRLNIYTSDISIISYKLVLLPVWVGNYRFEKKSYLLFMHGLDLSLANAELPPTKLQKFAAWLLGKDEE